LVDIELVEPVAAGDVVLVHAGVALALLERAVVA
jgi:hydrogenase maturation factor